VIDAVAAFVELIKISSKLPDEYSGSCTVCDDATELVGYKNDVPKIAADIMPPVR
jgi:hypothetical protein